MRRVAPTLILLSAAATTWSAPRQLMLEAINSVEGVLKNPPPSPIVVIKQTRQSFTLPES